MTQALNFRQFRLRCWFVLSLLVLTGCAQPVYKAVDSRTPNAYWSGRLSLRTEGIQTQTFAANFELSGNASAGDLSLFSPFGNTLAVLKWDPQTAELQSNGEIKKYDSLEQLTSQLSATPLPITSLFQWLQGFSTPTVDWEADLQFVSEGKLTVRSIKPDSSAELKLLFEPPAPRR